MPFAGRQNALLKVVRKMIYVITEVRQVPGLTGSLFVRQVQTSLPRLVLPFTRMGYNGNKGNPVSC